MRRRYRDNKHIRLERRLRAYCLLERKCWRTTATVEATAAVPDKVAPPVGAKEKPRLERRWRLPGSAKDLRVTSILEARKHFEFNSIVSVTVHPETARFIDIQKQWVKRPRVDRAVVQLDVTHIR